MARVSRITALVLIILLTAQVSACVTVSTDDTQEISAQETLQAVYAEQTAAAGEPEEEAQPAGTAAPAQPDKKKQNVQQNRRNGALRPEDVPETSLTLEDSDSSTRAEEHRTLSGDNFLNNLYERPFTSEEMIYQPDLDIQTVDFAYDDDFFYFTITLNSMNVDVWRLTGAYSIEFDRSLTGRGDLIVRVENPTMEWSPKNVIALTDVNVDVGGPTPIYADEGFSGNGYDKRLDLTGETIAFARINPEDNQSVQIAVSQGLLDYPEEFLWGAWADGGLKKLTMFDYNDAIGQSEAGSPYIDDQDYPVKALYNLDNTCRLPYGFDRMSASYPGMCISSVPAAEPGEEEPDCYCTDYCIDGVTCCGTWVCE
jgi:hypothetical protein